MQTENFGFTDYQLYKESLSKLIIRSIQIFNNLKQFDIAKRLEITNNRLDSGVFRILVMGEFNRGKSTIINALLGEKVLPMKAVPTTGIVNEVKFGEEKKAILYFKNPLPEKRGEVVLEAERHINKYYPNPIPPMEVPYLQLKDFVVIKNRNEKEAEIAASPYSKLELFYPAELLQNGVEIFDSPGLNEGTQRTTRTLDSLENADAVVYVFNAKSLASSTELISIDSEINERGFRKIFFIINHWDDVASEDEDDIKQDAFDILPVYTDYGKEGIFFLAARDALRNRSENYPRTKFVDAFKDFEDNLFKNLIRDAGRTKIDRPLKQTKIELKRVDRIVSELLKSYEQTLEETSKSYNRALPLLDSARKSKELTLSNVKLVRGEIKDLVSEKVNIFLLNLNDQIPNWIGEMNLENKLKPLLIGKNKKIAAQISIEIQQNVDERIYQELKKWEQAELNPEVDKLAQKMNDFIQEGSDDLAASLSRVSEAFTGTSFSDEERQLTQSSIGERIFTGAGALLIGDIPLAIYGAQYGTKGFGRALLTQVGIGATLAIIGIANPLIWISAAFGGSFLSSFLTNEKTNNDYKRKIGYEFQKKFADSIPQQSKEMGAIIYERTERISQQIEESFDAQIRSEREKVEAALKIKEKGAASVEAARMLAEEQILHKGIILRELEKLENQGI